MRYRSNVATYVVATKPNVDADLRARRRRPVWQGSSASAGVADSTTSVSLRIRHSACWPAHGGDAHEMLTDAHESVSTDAKPSEGSANADIRWKLFTRPLHDPTKLLDDANPCPALS